MKKEYIKPIIEVYTIKVCTPIATSPTNDVTIGEQGPEDTENTGAREDNFSTSNSHNIWSEEW